MNTQLVMAFRTALLLSLLAGPVFAAAQPGVPPSLSRDGQQRLAARQVRIQLAKDYKTARLRGLSAYLSGLEKLAGWLIEQKARLEAEAVLNELEKENPQSDQLAKLRKAAGELATVQALQPPQQRDYEQRLAMARRAGANSLLDLARRCNQAGLVSYAYDLLLDVLALNPDDATSRAALGYVKNGSEWLPTFEALQQRKGLRYLAHLGWAPTQAVSRIEKGEWFEDGRWMPLAEADKLHADLNKPWIIETESFTLKSTCGRQEAIRIAERLEAIRQCCYRQYLDFFLRGSGKRGAQLLFNTKPTEKLLVHYFATKEDYAETIRRGRFGSDPELLLRSVGFYSSGNHASYFYRLDWGNGENLTTMQHEVTHQILGEYAHGGDAPVWLTEGMAETLEYARPDAQGRLQIPSRRAHADVNQVAKWLKTNELPSIKNLLQLTDKTFHTEPSRMKNYQYSGAFCRFLLEFENAAYATDFIEYGYDTYAGRAKTPFTDYMAMSIEDLDREFQAYLKE